MTKIKLDVIYCVNNKKGKISMVEATISKETKRNAFAKLGAERIASGVCSTNKVVNGLVLDGYKHLASGVCSDIKIKNNELTNIIMFAKQKEVA